MSDFNFDVQGFFHTLQNHEDSQREAKEKPPEQEKDNLEDLKQKFHHGDSQTGLVLSQEF